MPSRLDPARTALLVMDVQPGIVGRIPDPDALLERVQRAVAAARDRGATVGYVRVALTDEEAAAVPAHSQFAAMVRDGANPLHADAPHTQVHDAVAPQDGDVVVRKSRVGAFSTTDLAAQLRERGVDALVLCGISTSGVVLSTVRDAADRDLRLVVLADGCADGDPEVHRVLVEKVLPRQAEVVAVDELEALLGG